MSVDQCMKQTNTQILAKIIDEKLNNKEIPLAISSQVIEEAEPMTRPLSKSMEESEQSIRPSRSRKAPERFDPSNYIVTRIKKSNKITPSQTDLKKKIEEINNDSGKRQKTEKSRADIKHRLPWIQRAVWLKKRKELLDDPAFIQLQKRIVDNLKKIYSEYKPPIEIISRVEELYLRKLFENRHQFSQLEPKDIIDKVNLFIKNTLPIRTPLVTEKEREYLIEKYPKSRFESLIKSITQNSKPELTPLVATVVCELPTIIKKELETQIITDEDIKMYEDEMKDKFNFDTEYPDKSPINFQKFLQSQPQITDEDLIDLDLEYIINKLQETTIGTSSILPTTKLGKRKAEGIKKSSTRKLPKMKLPKMKLPKMKLPKMKVPKVFKKTVGKNKKPKKGDTRKRKLKVTHRRKQHGSHCKQCHTSKRN